MIRVAHKHEGVAARSMAPGNRNAHSPAAAHRRYVLKNIRYRIRSSAVLILCSARLLQALWRKDRNLPIGSYVNEDGKRRKLGSRISEAVGREAAISSPPRSLIPPGARPPIGRSARGRRGAARDEPPLVAAAHLQFAGTLGHALERASGYLLELPTLPFFLVACW